jgi:hypothetical protein
VSRPALLSLAGRSVHLSGHPSVDILALVERICSAEKIALADLTWRRSHPRKRLHRKWEPVIKAGPPLTRSYRIIETTFTLPAKRLSSGRTWSQTGRVVITAGSDPLDARVVLIHELAHLAVGEGHGHDGAFWDRDMELLSRYLKPAELPYAVTRETGYRKGARTAAHRGGVI